MARNQQIAGRVGRAGAWPSAGGNRVDLSIGCGQLVRTEREHKEVVKSQAQAGQSLS